VSYGLVVALHLVAAIAFAGTVFFEVVMLEGMRRHVPPDALRAVERAIGQRAVRIMPWVLAILYGAGVTLAWHHRAAFAAPLASPYALLLTIKVALAVSVFAHFATAMTWRLRGTMTGRRSRRLHASVFVHVLAIVLLAKAMLLPLSW